MFVQAAIQKPMHSDLIFLPLLTAAVSGLAGIFAYLSDNPEVISALIGFSTSVTIHLIKLWRDARRENRRVSFLINKQLTQLEQERADLTERVRQFEERGRVRGRRHEEQ